MRETQEFPLTLSEGEVTLKLERRVPLRFKAMAVFLALGIQASVYAASGPLPDLSSGDGPNSLCGPPAPEEVFPVQFAKSPGNVTRMTWWSQWGYYTDIVRGSLTILAATGGDFGMATCRCLREDLDNPDAAAFEDPDVPSAGEGYWYLLRFDQYSGCPNGEGTYNSRGGRQVGDRNLEIQTSGHDCLCFYRDGQDGYCTVYYP